MRIAWNDVSQKLALDDGQATRGAELLNRGKDAVLELWAAEAANGEPAPIDVVASLSSKTSVTHNPAAWGRLIEYLSTKKKRGADSTYLEMQAESERSIKEQLHRLLNSDQIAAFERLGIGSLLIDVDTGYTPIDDRIAALIAARRAR